MDIALPNVEKTLTEAGVVQRLHAEERLLMLAHAVTAVFRPKQHPAWRLLSKATPKADTIPYVILAPGAGSPIRVWPIDRLAAVGRALVERYGLEIMVIGGASEWEAGETIANALPQGSVRNLAGRLPLRELPDIVRGAQVYVGYDTGTTHLAAALSVPTVSILSGVPSAAVWHTVGEHVAVVAGQIACSPCYLTHADQCPYGVACLNVISVEHVLDACHDLMSSCLNHRWERPHRAEKYELSAISSDAKAARHADRDPLNSLPPLDQTGGSHAQEAVGS